MYVPNDSQVVLAQRIEKALQECDLVLFKRRNTQKNLAMTPALALAVALYPALEQKTREGGAAA